MPYLIARLLDWNERDLPRDYAADLGRRYPPMQGAGIQLVRRQHPHFAFRAGFPEFRQILAIAPHGVLVNGPTLPAWVSLLSSLGIPVTTDNEPEKLQLGNEARWTRPKLQAPEFLAAAQKAARITILGDGVAVQPDDGLTIGLDPLAPFAEPAPDYFVWRRRALMVALNTDHGTAVHTPVDDALLTGGPVLPVVFHHTDRDAFARAIVRSSAIWPSKLPSPRVAVARQMITDHDQPLLLERPEADEPIRPAGKLTGSAEVWRYRDVAWSLSLSWVVMALRNNGVRAPILYRVLPLELQHQRSAGEGLELAMLHQVGAPFRMDAEGEPRTNGRPLGVRIEPGGLNLAVFVTGIADWFAQCRGDVLDLTWVSGPPEVLDFFAASGFRTGEAPAGVPVATIGVPLLDPIY